MSPHPSHPPTPSTCLSPKSVGVQMYATTPKFSVGAQDLKTQALVIAQGLNTLNLATTPNLHQPSILMYTLVFNSCINMY